VKACLEKAMQKLNLPDPGEWTSMEELRLIEEYLEIRAVYGKYPMTDAHKRATVTKKYLANGTISSERGSFLYNL
jgi:hypothetical protein